jgi:hypothetical protein
MHVIVRDAMTNANVEVDSLTGFVNSPPVEQAHPGTPLSEASRPQREAYNASKGGSFQSFSLTSDDIVRSGLRKR